MRKITLIGFGTLIALGASTACTTFDRSLRSGYAERGPKFSADASEVQGPEGRLAREAREELGFGFGPLGAKDRRALDARVALKRAEAAIPSRRERRAYYAVRANLADDDQRLDYLAQVSPSARTRYLIDHHVKSPDADRSDELVAAIEAKDVALGMTAKAVAESWGDPDQVEVSGDVIYGVARWRYNRYVSGDEGYRQETRYVYFDGGRVVGWERR